MPLATVGAAAALWIGRAVGRAVGNVPRSRFFTEDPYVLRWQWRRVADAIVLVK
eukprot:SAG11_NODE_3029_length_2753_cov_8.497739_1_plen_53_part_10